MPVLQGSDRGRPRSFREGWNLDAWSRVYLMQEGITPMAGTVNALALFATLYAAVILMRVAG